MHWSLIAVGLDDCSRPLPTELFHSNSHISNGGCSFSLVRFQYTEKTCGMGQVAQFLRKAVRPSLIFLTWLAACLLSFPLCTVFSLMIFEKVFLSGGGSVVLCLFFFFFVTSACFKSLQLFWLMLVIEQLYILKKLEKVVLY